MRLPHDDLVVRLERRQVHVSWRTPRFGVHHVVELLLVGADAHARRVLSLLRENGEIDRGVARTLGLAVAHRFQENLGEFFRSEFEIEEGADGNAELGTFVERGRAEGDGTGERHAPEADLIRIDEGMGKEESEGVRIVGNLFHRVDLVPRFTVRKAEGARVVDECCNIGELKLLGYFRNEHLFDTVKLQCHISRAPYKFGEAGWFFSIRFGSELTPGVMIIAGPREAAGYSHPRIVRPSRV